MDVTNEDPATAEPGPDGAGLWAVAHYWVDVLAAIFEPNIIATTGITRSFALRCRNWLWAIEGLVRRLIIAAARKLDIDDPAPIQSRTSRREHTSAPSIAFAVLPRLPGRQTHTRATPSHSCIPRHRHLAFPGDALLHLFPRHDRRNAPATGAHALNPLHRRGRRHRHDPDYRGGEDVVPRVRSQPVEDRIRAGSGRCTRTPWWTPEDDVPEWKRVEREWERVIASPRLARRIDALIRVMAHPERIIARTARHLRADAALIARLRLLPPPVFRKPRLDRGPIPPLLDELAVAHIRAFDTS